MHTRKCGRITTGESVQVRWVLAVLFQTSGDLKFQNKLMGGGTKIMNPKKHVQEDNTAILVS